MHKRGRPLLSLKLPRLDVEEPVVDLTLPGPCITEIVPNLFIGGKLTRQRGGRQS